MNRFTVICLLCSLICLSVSRSVLSQTEETPPQPVFVALLGVYGKGEEVKELAPKINSLLVAALSTRTDMMLVEREEMDKVFSELELSLSGMVDPKTASDVGRMTGAQILISAATFEVDGTLYIVAKLIGVETTRVVGVTAKGQIQNALDTLVEKLATDVGDTISKRQAELIAPKRTEEDRIAAIKKKLGKATLPVLAISIPEQHVGKAVADPAAQTELVHICRELGFTVIDAPKQESKADLVISGQSVSEFAMQRQNLVGVRARVELSVKNREGKVFVADRQTISKLALTERIAGKVAIEQAAAQIAERILPQLVEQWNKK